MSEQKQVCPNVDKTDCRNTLRSGFTTGTCVAAASKAALMFWLGDLPRAVETTLPTGEKLSIPIFALEKNPEQASAFVIKDAGDDPDVTDGLLIGTRLTFQPGRGQITIQGGEGVGQVTRPGLLVKVGEWAINPVPRRQIEENVREVLPEGWDVTVEVVVPEGKEAARHTFNTRLGIEGGISILGTTGRVKPMSVEAYRETIACSIRQAKAMGEDPVVLVPGNYGEQMALACGFPKSSLVRISGYVGFALDECARGKVPRVLMLGQVGKMVKVAGGNFNTHQEASDARREILFAHLVRFRLPRKYWDAVWQASSSEEAAHLVRQWNLQKKFWDYLAGVISKRVSERTRGAVRANSMIFSLKNGILGSDGTWGG